MKSPLKFRSPRYTRAFNAILSDPRVSDQQIRIYLLIKSFEGKSNSAFPTIQTLMKLSGASKSKIIRVVEALEALHLIKVVKTHLGNERERNLYLVDDIPYIQRIPAKIQALRKSAFRHMIGPLVTPIDRSAGDTPSKAQEQESAK